MFYVYGTMGNGFHIQVASSPDLVAWTHRGEALTPPKWMSSASWAPDVTQHGKQFFMYFGASQAVDGLMCIAVATSDSPLGPFTDARGSPLFCSPSQTNAFAAIDPKSWDDVANNRILLYFGSDFVPISMVELAPSRTALASGSPAPFAAPLLFPDASQPYESLIEAAWLLPHNGSYVLLYSGDACCGAGAHYAVMAARASSPTGPFTKLGAATGRSSSVILSADSSSAFAAPGHNCIISDDNGVEWMLYHAYKNNDLNGPRLLLLDRLRWDAEDWPEVTAPTSVPQPAPVVRPLVHVEDVE